MDLQGDNCNRCYDSKTELPLLLLDHVLYKTHAPASAALQECNAYSWWLQQP